MGITQDTPFKFDWDNQKRMLTTTGALILSFGVLLLIAIWIGLMVGVYTISAHFENAVFWSDIIVISISLIIVCVTTIVGISVSSKKLSNLDWNL